MGEFPAGKWIVILSLYFFVFFIIVNYTISASNHYGLSTSARFNDPGFGSESINISTPNTASASDNADVSNIKASVAVITGINAGDVDIGLPTWVIYIFSFIFFWLPFAMMLIALYFILPFFH